MNEILEEEKDIFEMVQETLFLSEEIKHHQKMIEENQAKIKMNKLNLFLTH